MDAALLTGTAFWNDLTPTGSGEIPDLPELAGQVLFETSGSSGQPKSLAISKQALLISAAAVNQHFAVTAQSCWGLALPLNHVGGFGVLARAYQAGCRVESFSHRWQPLAFREWLAKCSVSHLSLVPTQVHDLVKAKLTAPAALTVIVVGGGQLDSATGQAARALGWPVLASYGMTEAASQIASQSLDMLELPYQPTPLSLLPIWDAQISVAGQLSIAGPALFSGTVTAGKFSPRLLDWYLTADLARLDHRQLTPQGRADHLIKILGELVDPQTIEQQLIALSHGELAPGRFAVITLPDERCGHVLVPIFESSVPAPLIASTLALYHLQAPGFRRLQPASVLGELPRSDLGKVRRVELTEIYLRRLIAFPK